MSCIIRVPSSPSSLPTRLQEDFPTFIETFINTIQQVLADRFPNREITVLQGGRSPLNINGVTDISFMAEEELEIITFLTYDDTWQHITKKVVTKLHRTVEDSDLLPEQEQQETPQPPNF